MFACPSTGLKVQSWVTEETLSFDHFEAMECAACQRMHLVNPRTGKVAGSEAGPEAAIPAKRV